MLEVGEVGALSSISTFSTQPETTRLLYEAHHHHNHHYGTTTTLNPHQKALSTSTAYDQPQRFRKGHRNKKRHPNVRPAFTQQSETTPNLSVSHPLHSTAKGTIVRPANN